MKHQPHRHRPATRIPWKAVEGDVLNGERPWGVVKLASRRACIEVDGNTKRYGSMSTVIAEVTDGAKGVAGRDAEFIAHAVNNYARMVTVLRTIAARPTPNEASILATAVLREVDELPSTR